MKGRVSSFVCPLFWCPPSLPAIFVFFSRCPHSFSLPSFFLSALILSLCPHSFSLLSFYLLSASAQSFLVSLISLFFWCVFTHILSFILPFSLSTFLPCLRYSNTSHFFIPFVSFLFFFPLKPSTLPSSPFISHRIFSPPSFPPYLLAVTHFFFLTWYTS